MSDAEEEHRAVVEEMRAAWRYETEEWRLERARLEWRLARAEAACVALLAEMEEAARAAVAAEEAAAARALAVSHARRAFLQRPLPTDRDSAETGAGLHALCRSRAVAALVPDAEWAELLSGAWLVEELYFSAAEAPPAAHWDGDHHTLPAGELADVARRAVCRLPCLWELGLAGLPALRTHVLPWAASLPPSLRLLSVLHTPFAVADARALLERCPHLSALQVTAARCADLAGLTEAEAEELREATAAQLDERLQWCD